MPALRSLRSSLFLLVPAAAMVVAGPAEAQFRQTLNHDPAYCRPGAGPAVQISLTDVKASTGTIRVQLYRGTQAEWLASGKWLYRIEASARAGQMSFCMPVPQAGTYAIAIRHDVNGNGSTDLAQDGGGMSNNPSINIFNLGRPSVRRTAFTIGNEVKPMTIRMRYLSGN